MSIIGKKYIPFDNSYSVNITNCSNYPYNNVKTSYLAGNQGGELAKECIIKTEPFKCNIKTWNNNIEEKEMVVVSYRDNDYVVMFRIESIL